jgi:hypothetical protein
MRYRKGSVKRKVYSHEHIYKNVEKSQITDVMLLLKLLEKPEQAKSKARRRTEIIKIRAQINDKETKNTYNNNNKKKLVL